MTRPKYLVFADNIENVLDTFDRDYIKGAIGDSINNNRTLTVSQLSRFLSTRRSPALNRLAAQLDAVYASSVVRQALSNARTHTLRTDAIDINEFLNLVGVKNSRVSRSVSQSLAA